MDLDHFMRSREPGWKRLEQLLNAFEKSPAWEGGPERVKELVALYRQACSDLNQARSYTANPDLLGALNELTGRGYRLIYTQSSGSSLRETLWTFFAVHIPATFQKEVKYVLAALLPFLLGALFGYCAVSANPSNATAFIPAMFFNSSPKERVKDIEDSGKERIDTMEKALSFGSSLYTHNIQVTFAAFSLGALTLIGGVYLLFYNGVILGAMACMYHADGVAPFFYAWVGPHGALELPAIIFGGAAGLRAGRALLFPGELTRQASVREAFAPVWRMLCAAAVMLVFAGMIEGSFSQFSARTVSYGVKIGVALCLFASLMAYLFFLKLKPVSLAACAKNERSD